MRIVEDNELSYSVSDIVEAIEDELGFTMIKTADSKGYFMLGRQIKLSVDFDKNGGVEAVLEFPDKKVDLSDNTSQAELYSLSIESAVQVTDIMRRMTKEGGVRSEEDNI